MSLATLPVKAVRSFQSHSFQRASCRACQRIRTSECRSGQAATIQQPRRLLHNLRDRPTSRSSNPSRLTISTTNPVQKEHCQPQQQRRTYISQTHPQPFPYNPTETAILSAAVRHIPAYGFTTQSLQFGARDAGYLSISTNLFPRGAFELVRFWLVKCRLGLQGRVDGGEEGGGGLRADWEAKKVGVGARVKGLILERLAMNVEGGIVGRWQEAVALMAQPSYIPVSLRELHNLSDEIWYLAGDIAVDTSWYTKRASLSAIYAATEIYQTQDTSLNFKDTERFLDDRLDGARRVGGAIGDVAQWVGFTGLSAVNVLRSKGVRI